MRRTILITGGAGGIGRASARRLAATMDVIVADRDAEVAVAVAEELRSFGARTLGIGVDVGNRSMVRDMVEAARRAIGPIHALFNNAGVALSRPVETTTGAEWDLVLDTHVKGAFLCAQAVLPDMIAHGGGVIVNMCSIYATTPMANGAAYAAAKSALYSLTKSLAAEFIGHGIRVNALAPGPIETLLLRGDRSEGDWLDWKAKRADSVPVGRIGSPDDVAAALEFLASDRASYITGQLLHVNGGLAMP